jgi:hypothetical protein
VEGVRKVENAAGMSVFDWLLGAWTFSREVPGYASIMGEARVTAEGEDGARYQEAATVSLVGGETLRAAQCYRYRRLAQPLNGFEVLFCETAELFERLDFRDREGALRARAQFSCGADLYESEYVADGRDRLIVEHAVRGPRKNYRVRTIYSRRTNS